MTTTTTKQEQQLRVDLDRIHNPHEDLVRAYKDAGMAFLDLDVLGKSIYVNEAHVFAAAKVSKKPIKHQIVSMYRKRVLTKEYLYLHEHIVAFDYFGNTLDHSRILGTFEKPLFRKTYAINPQTLKADQMPQELHPEVTQTEIEGHESIYLYEFKDMKEQLQSWYESEIIGVGCNYYIIPEDKKKYSVRSFKEFIDLSIEDNLLINNHAKKYAGVFNSGEPINVVLDFIRAKIKSEMSITNTTK